MEIDIKKKIEQHKKEFIDDLQKVNTLDELEAFRIKYLSRQGLVSQLMQEIKNLNLEEKKIFGPLFNELKRSTQEEFNKKNQQISNKNLESEEIKHQYFDVTAYKNKINRGSLHPYTHALWLIEDIFITMGYEIVDGPEVETDYHNFEALNIPADHPARDMQDTFWLTIPNLLMRTHTSSVEVHQLLQKKPPIAIIAPGRCYRNEATDASHDFMFMQVEGLFVDKVVNLGQLFATVRTFLQSFFNKKDLKIRTRPSYFPFVEPGIEIDMSCPFCESGCSVCKGTSWIEICGAGLTHPNVLKFNKIDPDEYSGFAFGFGLTRLVMLKYGITDIRLLHSNKVNFLKQF